MGKKKRSASACDVQGDCMDSGPPDLVLKDGAGKASLDAFCKDDARTVKERRKGVVHEDITLRPSMPKVVQMLQSQCPVPDPPVSHLTASRIYSGLVRPGSEDSNSSMYIHNPVSNSAFRAKMIKLVSPIGEY
ncbi:hypothetical protein V2J09_011116 [Rumex salicifolius]